MRQSDGEQDESLQSNEQNTMYRQDKRRLPEREKKHKGAIENEEMVKKKVKCWMHPSPYPRLKS